MQYDVFILQKLLDSYENSLLSRGENQRNIHVAFHFSRKTIPSYYDESSLVYEDIHAALKQLENKGLLRICWVRGKEGHIVQKVMLREENAPEAYRLVHRIPKTNLIADQLRLLKDFENQLKTPTAQAFTDFLKERLSQGQSVKEFTDLADTEETRRLILAISAIEQNMEELYLREFSVKAVGDSKYVENHLSKIAKVFHRFDDHSGDSDIRDILAEHRIYQTPNYVYLKGAGRFSVGDKERVIDLADFRQGIGISGEDLDTFRWGCLSGVSKVITIENLTTFFRCREENSILIYLAGYHNQVRRRLLRSLYEAIPEAEYLHFGDIDAGGFTIYLDLCKKTGIPFSPWLMGKEQLLKHKSSARALTEHDRERLESLLQQTNRQDITDTIKTMLKENIKLEQESENLS